MERDRVWKERKDGGSGNKGSRSRWEGVEGGGRGWWKKDVEEWGGGGRLERKGHRNAGRQ